VKKGCIFSGLIGPVKDDSGGNFFAGMVYESHWTRMKGIRLSIEIDLHFALLDLSES
jgi:hypothetical protein